MQFSIWQLIIYLIAPSIMGLIAYIWRTDKITHQKETDDIKMEIKELDKRLYNTISEDKVRAIIEDKVTNIQEDLKEIKTSLRNFFLLYAQSKISPTSTRSPTDPQE